MRSNIVPRLYYGRVRDKDALFGQYFREENHDINRAHERMLNELGGEVLYNHPEVTGVKKYNSDEVYPDDKSWVNYYNYNEEEGHDYNDMADDNPRWVERKKQLLVPYEKLAHTKRSNADRAKVVQAREDIKLIVRDLEKIINA